MKKITLDGNNLNFEKLQQVAVEGYKVEITSACKKNIKATEDYIRRAAENNEVHYGITTGFGSLCNQFINGERAIVLQHNILKSHAVGVGAPLDKIVVRAILLLRMNTLIQGFSGVTVKTVDTFCQMLNRGVHPVIPSQGSVGASGDLCPLAHMALPMIGFGEAEYKGNVLPGAEAMKKAGIPILKLTYKEGLALTNGTQVMTAIGWRALSEAEEILKTADVAAAMSLEAICGKGDAFDPLAMSLRPFPGQKQCADNIRKLIRGSKLVDAMRYDFVNGVKVARKIDMQDSYSLRCVPQVHGASRNALDHVRKTVEIEIGSVTDNPHIFPKEGRIMSAGNFHGQPLALAMDYMKLAVHELGNISERRAAKLLDKNHNMGLPAFLVRNAGLNSGLMIAQYTAAALVSENKVLVHPASADSIPTSANQEDHVSMGTIAARQAREILGNVRKVFAIEMLFAAQALELRMQDSGLKPGKGTQAAFNIIRKHIPFVDNDRPFYLDIAKCLELVESGEVVHAAEKAAGELF